MVRGLDLFRERFRKFDGSFILIGGAACDEWFSSVGLEFRATKDLDIVLIIEAINPEFVATPRAFIEEGEYEIRQRTEGTPVLYRFVKPKREEFFSRKPEGLDLAEGQKIVPFPTDATYRSLSANEVGETVDSYDTMKDTLSGEGDYDAWKRFVGMETVSALNDVYEKRGLSVRVEVRFEHWYYKDEAKALDIQLGQEKFDQMLAEIIHEYPKDWTPYRQEKEETCPDCGSHFQPLPHMMPGSACLHCLKEKERK